MTDNDVINLKYLYILSILSISLHFLVYHLSVVVCHDEKPKNKHPF